MVIWLISTGEVHNYRHVTDKDNKKDTLFSLLSLRVKLYRKDQFTHLSRSYWSLRGKTCAGSGCHLQRKGENRALLNSGILNALRTGLIGELAKSNNVKRECKIDHVE